MNNIADSQRSRHGETTCAAENLTKPVYKKKTGGIVNGGWDRAPSHQEKRDYQKIRLQAALT
jgi:hypothetical protein